jgi:hypothetical protein
MAITNTWTVSQLDCYPEYEGEQDVVFACHWRLNATDGTYNGSAYGSIGLTLDPDADFVSFADLTEEQVIGWVQDALGEEQVDALEANLAKQIEDQANPPVVSPTLPWAAA